MGTGGISDGYRIGATAATALERLGYQFVADLPKDLDELLATPGIGLKGFARLRAARARSSAT